MTKDEVVISESSTELKYQLLEEIFSMGGNHRPEKIEMIKAKLQSYAEDYRYSLQIRDALIVLKTFDIENRYNDFETCCMLSVPVFERLEQTTKWDFYDIRILTYVIDYAETYMQAHSLALKALNKLKDYSYEKQYKRIRLGILLNMTFRLLRENFSKKQNHGSKDQLAEMFSEYTDLVMELSDETDIIPKATVLVRRGIFYGNFSIANKGFELLKENNEHEVYKLLRDEARDYKLNIYINKEEKKQFDVFVGENIRSIRIKHNMTISDLAKILRMQQELMSMIELGQKSASTYMLFKLSTALDEPVENFFNGTEMMLPDSDNRKALIEKLIISVKNLQEDRIECIIDIVKSLSKSKFGKLN